MRWRGAGAILLLPCLLSGRKGQLRCLKDKLSVASCRTLFTKSADTNDVLAAMSPVPRRSDLRKPGESVAARSMCGFAPLDLMLTPSPFPICLDPYHPYDPLPRSFPN